MPELGRWKSYDFFTHKPLRSSTAVDLAGKEITAFVAGCGFLFVGTAEGSVYIIDRDQNATVFAAHREIVTHLVPVRAHNGSRMLVTVGDGLWRPHLSVPSWRRDAHTFAAATRASLKTHQATF